MTGGEMTGGPDGRVALVTGAGRGLGLVIAQRLAADGHRVVGTYRADHPDVDGITWVTCDVADSASVDAAFAEIEALVGPVEILVANAGVTNDKLVLRMSDDDFASVIDTNLVGSFRCARRAGQKMVRGRWGRIIFISSVVARIGQAGQVNYAASKAGIEGMARSLARELASRSICVNVVAPGPLPTDMLDALDDDRRAAIAAAVPLGRLGRLDEVAAAVAFLASEEAGYITGVTLGVDGGLGLS
jgi:NAD(P)-dependent dehydrogenase (short-subunit alcohol dehydrogenase family)